MKGERHFNVRKAQLLTGAAVGSSALATGAVAAYAFGDPSAPLFGMENVFWVLMSCTTAGRGRHRLRAYFRWLAAVVGVSTTLATSCMS